MIKTYKLFRVKNGKLYPLFVLADKETPFNKWLDAEEGETKETGKVKSRLGDLAYRPGWHSSALPLATHIGQKVNGEIKYMHDNHVWVECYINNTVDYQNEAKSKGKSPKNQYLKRIPVNGFYTYKTNPNMFGNWFISGEIKLNRVLSDQEVEQILKENGLSPLPRKGEYPVLNKDYFVA